jgi:hypothetical protein
MLENSQLLENKKLSDLLELGLRDMERFVAEGNEIHMSTWILKVNDYCVGCMAGAIMYCTERVTGVTIVPTWAQAIDLMRRGYLKHTFDFLERPFPKSLPSRVPITSYYSNKEEFKRDIESVITLLRGVGE